MILETPWVALCKHDATADPEEIFVADDHGEVERAAAKWWAGHEYLDYDQSLRGHAGPRKVGPQPNSPWKCLNGYSVEVTEEPLPLPEGAWNEGPGARCWMRTVSVVHMDGDGPVILFMQGKDVSSFKVQPAKNPHAPMALLHDEVQVIIPADADLEAMAQGLSPLIQSCASDAVLGARAAIAALSNLKAVAEAPEEERAAYRRFLEATSAVRKNPDDVPTFEQWALRARGRRNPNLD